MIILSVVIIGVLLGAAIDLWKSFVAVKLYNWFILTLCPALPHITVLQMFGIILFLSAVQGYKAAPKDKEGDAAKAGIQALITAATYPALILAFGWILKSFM